jgi:serine/threonine-protein kinase
VNDAGEEAYVSPHSQPGAVIDEKYRVDGVIGRGGVGLVVAATHLAMSQRVAIKMIRDDVPMQRELLDRFQKEAQAAAMIKSEHVARVLDVGRLPTGRPYIVMELLEGEDLERVLARGALPHTAAVDLTLQACEALAEAHRAGIVHRDLKPANLFVTRRADGTPLVKVLDFGISKIRPLTAPHAGRPVETTSIMGSPGYMAPEQMKSTRDVDARADVWSLGAVLYEMLVGSPAFAGSNMIEILDAIAACDPRPPSRCQAGIPASLDLVLASCLTREPDHRFASVADLAVALSPYGSPASAGLAERVVRISQEPVPEYAEPRFAPLRSEPRPSSVTVVTPARRAISRRRTLLAAAGGAAAVGVVLLLGWALRAPPGGVPVLGAVAPPSADPRVAASAAAAPPSPAPADPSPSSSAWEPVAGSPSAVVPALAASTRPGVTRAANPPAAALRALRRTLPAKTPSSDFGDRK